MGAGLPVVATVIGATPEMITPGEDGFLVPQGDEETLLKTIVLLASDVDMRRRIGETARRTAKRHFDVAVTAGALRDSVRASLNNACEGHFVAGPGITSLL
jgi:glycosyltransferase involved in cell wall biosynthesis